MDMIKILKGWMNALQFYLLLINNISDISGQWDGDTERLCTFGIQFTVE